MVSSFNSYASGVMDELSPDMRAVLLAAGTRVQLGDGQLVQNRGNKTIDLAIILRGHIRLMTIGVDGSAMLTAILGPGQQFNEVTLFAGAARTHDAEAVGETELLTISAAQYHSLAEQHPQIAHALLVSNVQRVHQLVEFLNDLRGLAKPVVLARLLLKNARHTRGTSQTNSVELDISQEDIAMFLGVTRAYLNKVLGQLSDQGLIEISYRKVRVLDMAALERWIHDNLIYDAVENSGGIVTNPDNA